MPLRFLLDEQLRGPLWLAIVRHHLAGGLAIDAVRVGDPDDLPLGANDAAILLWAERENRILVTEDKHTLPRHLTLHVQGGHHSPGVVMIRPGFSISLLVSYLELLAHAGNPVDYENAITYVP
jgi:hypothetical protein